jgi:acylphosphatase
MTAPDPSNARAGAQCIRCLISGRVQGVFFRASARDQAQRLGVAGYARNLQDGRVEVLACGQPDALEPFRTWLNRGPSGAAVTAVDCEAQRYQVFEGFSTR